MIVSRKRLTNSGTTQSIAKTTFMLDYGLTTVLSELKKLVFGTKGVRLGVKHNSKSNLLPSTGIVSHTVFIGAGRRNWDVF